MRKKKFSWIRFLIKCLAWLIVLITVALIGIYLYLGEIVREVISREVPPITQTTASVDKVDLSLLKGNIEVINLKIGNPKGFSSNNIFELGQIRITFHPKTFLDDTIIIDSVMIDGTAISAELKSLTNPESNISVLQQNIASYLGSPSKTTQKAVKSDKKKTEQKADPGKKVIIKDLRIENTHISLGIGEKTTTLILPDIHKTHIGESRSQSPAEIMADVLNLVSMETLHAVQQTATEMAQIGIDEVSALIETSKEGISQGVPKALKNITGLFK